MPGIHHVTAIAGKATRNLDFYTRVTGLRLVKRTVNFDNPGTYHLYYGDQVGRPGTILTFFPWEHAAAGSALQSRPPSASPQARSAIGRAVSLSTASNTRSWKRVSTSRGCPSRIRTA